MALLAVPNGVVLFDIDCTSHKLAQNSIWFSGGHNRGAGLERVQPHHGHVLPVGREEAEGSEARPRPETAPQVIQDWFVSRRNNAPVFSKKSRCLYTEI